MTAGFRKLSLIPLALVAILLPLAFVSTAHALPVTPGYHFDFGWGCSAPVTASSRPHGNVAFDQAGNVFVADSSNDRIQKFAPDGTYISQVGFLRHR